MRRALAAALVAGALAVLSGGAVAQGQGAQPSAPQGPVRSPILTIDPERFFTESLFGQRIEDDLREETEALAAENRRIEAQLSEEEQRLTEERPDMAVEEFRAAAEAFDARVQEIRREQDAKERALGDIQSTGQEEFLSAATPVLGRLMLERGAVVILDQRSVFLGVGVVDITDEAIAAVDEALGDGSDADATPPEQAPELDGTTLEGAATAPPDPAPEETPEEPDTPLMPDPDGETAPQP